MPLVLSPQIWKRKQKKAAIMDQFNIKRATYTSIYKFEHKLDLGAI